VIILLAAALVGGCIAGGLTLLGGVASVHLAIEGDEEQATRLLDSLNLV